ncbi:MAG: type II toxin-antitoxin system RelE/ParE family toxin [Endomicrobium sp.]|jgi:phage-related protein|nr:type II toxin-antitoxin system RelE/ParE family toxin [Endomicrobium sp.]
MFEVIYFVDNNGIAPVKEYIDILSAKSKTNKDIRIQFNKIGSYINILEKSGTRVGEPIVKHLRDDIWELRPLQHRFLFAWSKTYKVFVLLHHFIKETSKTPPNEIKKAEKNFEIFKSR